MIVMRTGGAQLLVIGQGITVIQGGADAWWMAAGVAPVAAYAAKGAADLASSYINLANPGTFNCAPGVAPTWDATNGWTFNGSTQYLTTGVVPAAGWSAIVRYNNASASGAILGGGKMEIWPRDGSLVSYLNGNAYSSVGPNLGNGVLAVAGNKAYRNGVDEDVTLSAWTGTVTQGIILGARNNGSGGGTDFNGSKFQAVAIFNSTLNAAAVAALTTAMQLL